MGLKIEFLGARTPGRRRSPARGPALRTLNPPTTLRRREAGYWVPVGPARPVRSDGPRLSSDRERPRPGPEPGRGKDPETSGNRRRSARPPLSPVSARGQKDPVARRSGAGPKAPAGDRPRPESRDHARQDEWGRGARRRALRELKRGPWARAREPGPRQMVEPPVPRARVPDRTVMILPQVHLRKPCYDFYFL